MLKTLVQNKVKLAWSAIILLGFVLVRTFEDVLFYDPFLDYFKRDYTSIPYPEADPLKLILNFFLRYSVNSGLSLTLLYVIFRKKDIVRFAAILYVALFVCFLLAFIIFWKGWAGEQKTLLFYSRRFLIQPLLILLFLPAFYFQERIEKNNNA